MRLSDCIDRASLPICIAGLDFVLTHAPSICSSYENELNCWRNILWQGWWWERASVLSDGGLEDERFGWGVCAAAILRNLAGNRANLGSLADPECISLLVRTYLMSARQATSRCSASLQDNVLCVAGQLLHDKHVWCSLFQQPVLWGSTFAGVLNDSGQMVSMSLMLSGRSRSENEDGLLLPNRILWTLECR